MSDKDLQRVTKCVSDIGQAISRRSLPARRNHITQKVKIAGKRTLYIAVHDDENPAEIFLRVKGPDCSSELIGLYDVIARLMSLALQYGAPACDGRRSPRRRQICPMRPGVRARSSQALFEFAGFDWPTSVFQSCVGGRLTMISRARGYHLDVGKVLVCMHEEHYGTAEDNEIPQSPIQLASTTRHGRKLGDGDGRTRSDDCGRLQSTLRAAPGLQSD